MAGLYAFLSGLSSIVTVFVSLLGVYQSHQTTVESQTIVMPSTTTIVIMMARTMITAITPAITPTFHIFISGTISVSHRSSTYITSNFTSFASTISATLTATHVVSTLSISGYLPLATALLAIGFAILYVNRRRRSNAQGETKQ